ncbi:MAG TPA: metallophosphoesterase [Candidatus Thermoplasmatota archaeon]|nr:metallophosphoesterase [Candidatus Thermoplasmatota archaeon]
MRIFAALIVLLVALPAPAAAQAQPIVPPDFPAFLAREELAAAGETAGAVRVVRFVQVSDAHILDDDAPYPLRQEPLDRPGPPFDGAQRPQEEYTDEVLDAVIQAINARHAEDAMDFVINTGDNIDNELENELMRFIDNWEGTVTTSGPLTGLPCLPDGQSADPDDTSQDVVEQCASLPEALAANLTGLAPGLPWLSAFGNHDGLIQGNVPVEPGFNDIAAAFGRHFLSQPEYVAMHFTGGASCLAGEPAGGPKDDLGHGYGLAGERLCDGNPDNDGYYAFSLRGVRFVVLDTVNDDFVAGNSGLADLFQPQEALGYDLLGGYAEGSVDPAQFDWLLGEIEDHRSELVMVFSHHTVNSMFTDSAANPCDPGGAGCLADLLQEAGYKTGPEIISALSGYPNVVAWLGGHTHQHRIQPKQVAGAPSPGFWNVETSSLIDAPQEARVVELWVAADGAKGFLLLKDFGHDFAVSQGLAEGDPQKHPDAPGTEVDRDTLLWFDIPGEISLVPMEGPARHLRLRLVATAEDAEGYQGMAGQNVTLVVEATEMGGPLDGVPVEGLVVRVEGPFACPSADGRLPLLFGSVELSPGANGTYTGNLTLPGCTHYLTVRANDPLGRFAETTELVSLRIRPAAGEGGGKGSPGLALPVLVAAVAAALAVARRQKR